MEEAADEVATEPEAAAALGATADEEASGTRLDEAAGEAAKEPAAAALPFGKASPELSPQQCV